MPERPTSSARGLSRANLFRRSLVITAVITADQWEHFLGDRACRAAPLATSDVYGKRREPWSKNKGERGVQRSTPLEHHSARHTLHLRLWGEQCGRQRDDAKTDLAFDGPLAVNCVPPHRGHAGIPHDLSPTELSFARLPSVPEGYRRVLSARSGAPTSPTTRRGATIRSKNSDGYSVPFGRAFLNAGGWTTPRQVAQPKGIRSCATQRHSLTPVQRQTGLIVASPRSPRRTGCPIGSDVAKRRHRVVSPPTTRMDFESQGGGVTRDF